MPISVKSKIAVLKNQVKKNDFKDEGDIKDLQVKRESLFGLKISNPLNCFYDKKFTCAEVYSKVIEKVQVGLKSQNGFKWLADLSIEDTLDLAEKVKGEKGQASTYETVSREEHTHFKEIKLAILRNNVNLLKDDYIRDNEDKKDMAKIIRDLHSGIVNEFNTVFEQNHKYTTELSNELVSATSSLSESQEQLSKISGKIKDNSSNVEVLLKNVSDDLLLNIEENQSKLHKQLAIGEEQPEIIAKCKSDHLKNQKQLSALKENLSTKVNNIENTTQINKVIVQELDKKVKLKFAITSLTKEIQQLDGEKKELSDKLLKDASQIANDYGNVIRIYQTLGLMIKDIYDLEYDSLELTLSKVGYEKHIEDLLSSLPQSSEISVNMLVTQELGSVDTVRNQLAEVEASFIHICDGFVSRLEKLQTQAVEDKAVKDKAVKDKAVKDRDDLIGAFKNIKAMVAYTDRINKLFHQKAAIQAITTTLESKNTELTNTNTSYIGLVGGGQGIESLQERSSMLKNQLAVLEEEKLSLEEVVASFEDKENSLAESLAVENNKLALAKGNIILLEKVKQLLDVQDDYISEIKMIISSRQLAEVKVKQMQDLVDQLDEEQKKLGKLNPDLEKKFSWKLSCTVDGFSQVKQHISVMSELLEQHESLKKYISTTQEKISNFLLEKDGVTNSEQELEDDFFSIYKSAKPTNRVAVIERVYSAFIKKVKDALSSNSASLEWLANLCINDVLHGADAGINGTLPLFSQDEIKYFKQIKSSLLNKDLALLDVEYRNNKGNDEEIMEISKSINQKSSELANSIQVHKPEQAATLDTLIFLYNELKQLESANSLVRKIREDHSLLDKGLTVLIDGLNQEDLSVISAVIKKLKKVAQQAQKLKSIDVTQIDDAPLQLENVKTGLEEIKSAIDSIKDSKIKLRHFNPSQLEDLIRDVQALLDNIKNAAGLKICCAKIKEIQGYQNTLITQSGQLISEIEALNNLIRISHPKDHKILEQYKAKLTNNLKELPVL